MSDFPRSNYNREDPRLSRQNSTRAPSENSDRKSPSASSRDPRTRTLSTSSWDSSAVINSQFTQPPMQTGYQHLQSANMYNNTNQYPNQQPYYTGYENYNYNPYQYNQQGQYITGPVQPGPPGEDYPQGGWAPVAGGYQQPTAEFNHSGQQPITSETSEKTKEGVAEELIKQKTGLLKERETYEERAASLKKKLKLLIEQKDQLSSKSSPDRETLHIIKENTKLQVEIQSKIKDASNVIDILSGLIGDKKKQPESDEHKSKSSSKEGDAKSERINFKHYDPEIHWCRMCDVFPTTARDLLLHLHSKEHQDKAQEESPWHKLPAEPKFPSHEGGLVRRLPIKGLQFFVASTAWYCRLCDCWIGDLHCASQHLMSIPHSQNYGNFVEQNPHWEIEWLKDRDKAQDRVKRAAVPDADEQKRRLMQEKYSPPRASKDKKKKKRSKRRRRHSSDSSSSSSSSSSSDEDEKDDKSKSIRVAMRNKMKLLESEDKWDLIGKLVEERKRKESLQNEPKVSPKEDNLISQWMTISEPPDKLLMDNLKKMRQRQDIENAKIAAEREAIKREKEREELERKQREKERLELMQMGMAEKVREKMSLKLKEPTKIKGRDNYRRRRSPSNSPDRRRSRRSRSTSNDRRPNRNGRRSFDTSPHMRYEKEVKIDENKPERRLPPPPTYKKLPFIGRMPLFKNLKGKRPEEEKKEIQKEDYDIPRKTRFQPGNLARAYLPQPDVVHFPKLSCYPPIAPPPPVLHTEPPEPPKISVPKPPPPPKIDQEIEAPAEEAAKGNDNAQQDDYNMLYENTSDTIYPFGNVDFNMYHEPPESFNFMQVASDIPKSHTMPLQPPPLPPDDPNDDLAMLGISADDMAVQLMYN